MNFPTTKVLQNDILDGKIGKFNTQGIKQIIPLGVELNPILELQLLHSMRI